MILDLITVTQPPTLAALARTTDEATVVSLTGKTAFVVNPRSGQSLAESWMINHRKEITAIAAGGKVTIARNENEMKSAVDEALAANCSTVVAVGGDGTLNAVASGLVGRNAALGIIPMGTMNHLARDLGVPTIPTLALGTLTNGCITSVDVGEVNGHYFLNNSGIGLYADFLSGRIAHRGDLGRKKWLAFAWELLVALKGFSLLRVTLTVGDQAVKHITPIVFVGNNTYRTSGLQLGHRDGLQSGTLSICMMEKAGRARLLALGLYAFTGRLKSANDFILIRATKLELDTVEQRIGVALDGERILMSCPLCYQIHPRALHVVVPSIG